MCAHVCPSRAPSFLLLGLSLGLIQGPGLAGRAATRTWGTLESHALVSWPVKREDTQWPAVPPCPDALVLGAAPSCRCRVPGRARPPTACHCRVVLFPWTCCARAVRIAHSGLTGERRALPGTSSAGGRPQLGQVWSGLRPAGRRKQHACRPRSAGEADPSGRSVCGMARGVEGTPASGTRAHTWVRAVGGQLGGGSQKDCGSR